ncbi:MAG: efflux RND transporter periplasmic adaptor subunit, partial [Planctomycetes bacterium]|nr:efflux RND transporter periplasmic adaptor subunit [Planctomycetota bacterium]
MTSEERIEDEQAVDPSDRPAVLFARLRRIRWQLLVWPFAIFAMAGLLGAAVGYSVANRPKTEAQDTGKKTAEWWGCPMDPQVKLPKAGQCPICFMDLVPMEDDSDDNTERRLEMSEAAVKLAGIQTARVERRAVGRVVRMAGKIDHDETRLAQIVSRFPGYLERLYVDYTGMPVGQGEHLVDIYSPDLVVAQRELLQSLATYNRMTTPQDRQMAMTMMQSVEKKIKLLGFSAEQIEEIKRGGAPTDRLTINSPITGIVIEKHATEGMYVQKGMRIYTIADLKHVWLYLDAYESDIAWIHRGQEVQFTTESYPGEVFTGEVTFIYPVLDDKTRTVKVRVNVPNEHMRLKPGMFARASIRSKQPAGDRVLAASLAGKWISPMHPEIVKDGPGTCDICGMPLVPAETLGLVLSGDPAEDPLVIPATAPLITGKRAVVYVKVPGQAKPTFEGREIILGHRAGDYYIVHHGLKLDEEVVKVGSFKIDSSLQILARPSMMSPAELSDDPAAVPAVFRTRLTPLFQSYLVAGGALAADDPATARTAVIRLIELAKQAAETEAKEKLLAPDVRSNWTTVNDRIIFAAH